MVEPLANVTVAQQRELFDAAWLILKKRGVTVPPDYSTYQVAMEVTTALVGLRDRQLNQEKAHET